MKHELRRAILLTALLGCNEATTPSQPPVFTVRPAAQWSGGGVTVASHHFTGHGPLPTLGVGGDTLTPLRLDDSTVGFTLPEGPSGDLDLVVLRSGGDLALGTVRRVGFRASRHLLPALGGELYRSGSDIVGITYDPARRGRLGRVALGAGTGSVDSGLHGTMLDAYGPSPTHLAGHFVLRDTATGLHSVYDLRHGAPVAVDSVPFIGTNFVRHAARLSDSVWLFTGSHRSSTAIWGPTPVNPKATVETESPWRVFISPSAQRATLSENMTSTGVPVFDTQSGEPVYSLPIRGLEGAAFTPSGDQLFAAGGDYWLPRDVIRLDALTGAVLGQAVLPDSLAGVSLAYDPVHDRVYVAAFRFRVSSQPAGVHLVVFSGASLVLQGVLPAGLECDAHSSTAGCWGAELVLEPGTAHLVLPGTAATRDLQFDLLP